MTAAPPGQGGTQHVNEQPKEYWGALFSERGFRRSLRDELALQIGILEAQKRGDHVAFWFPSNLMIFTKRSANGN
jgi:hypothetical protein